MLESQFQAQLIKELKERFPGCIVLKNDANYIQGFPDLTIFYSHFWATLEVKASANASVQPNQRYYVDQCNEVGGYSNFIWPECKDAILDDLAKYFDDQIFQYVS